MCGVSLFLVGLDMPAVTFVQVSASFIGQVVGALGCIWHAVRIRDRVEGAAASAGEGAS